jgi:hypothetical protein
MKKKLLVSFLGLAVCLSFMTAQEAAPFSYKFTKAGGECLFTGKTYDEVWDAAVSALTELRWHLAVAQKDSGLISVQKGPSTGSILAVGLLAKKRNISFIIKKKDDGINMVGNCRGAKKRISPVYDRMGQILYSK